MASTRTVTAETRAVSAAGKPLSGAAAILIGEEGGDQAGWQVGGGCDLNQDGFDDALVGSVLNDRARTWAGAVWAVLGPISGTIALSGADAILTGERGGDYSGDAVSCGSDLDGDGYPDLVTGARYHDDGGTDAGSTYVLYGPVSGTIGLAPADIEVMGEADHDAAGLAVDGVGDVDGVGLGDLLVGAPGYGSAGAAYILLGSSVGSGTLAAADARFDGVAADDGAGIRVSGAGEPDADGLADLLVTAY